MSKKLVIVGGVAGGATAAARARRLDEHAEIVMFERGAEISFANCGLPYHIGGEIPRREALLVQTKTGLSQRFALDIRTRTEVTRIDRAAKVVHARDLASGRQLTETYDYLLLAPGAAPIVPPLPGVEHPQIFTLRNMADMDRIKAVVDGGAESALVVGGGFIGLEMAETLRQGGLSVALVELLPQVMPPLDPECAARLHQELARRGVQLYLENAVTAFDSTAPRVRAHLRDGQTLEADLILLAVGIRPDASLAEEAGLALGARGAIIVDEHMRTSDPAIYAVGDAVQVSDAVLGGAALVPLAGPANRQARIAVDNIFGRPTSYRGALGTSIVRVFNVTAAITGPAEKTLRQRGVTYKKVYVHRGQHAGYFPGVQQMMIKLLFAPGDGKLLGAQVVGGEGVDKRIDVLATAIRAGMSVTDLEDLELAYAPPYGAAKDPINIAGYVATNALRGDEAFVDPADLDDVRREQWTIVDVREPFEFEAGHVPGARLIPLAQLRERWREIPPEKPLAVYCGVGQRAYYATRILRDNGLHPRNVAGGWATYCLVHAPHP
jgi:NADPH-dependent 2,4-dienoyl-CoA reductase/sulfur reductase-like enzyme/rhodanese-related sulfurtransferase